MACDVMSCLIDLRPDHLDMKFRARGLASIAVAFVHTLRCKDVPRGGSRVILTVPQGAAGEHFRGLGLRDGDRRCFFSGGVF